MRDIHPRVTMRRLQQRMSRWLQDRLGGWRNLTPVSFAHYWYVRSPLLATSYAMFMYAFVLISAAYAFAIRPALTAGAFWVFIALLAVSFLDMFLIAWNPKAMAGIDEYLRDRRRYPRAAVMVLVPWIIGVLFGCSAYLGWRTYGDDFMIARPDVGLLDWAAYVCDNFIRIAFLDFAETYRLRVSDIEHANGLWPCTFVFLFRSLLSLSLISYWLAISRRLLQRDLTFSP